jgi:hypothetical protein
MTYLDSLLQHLVNADVGVEGVDLFVNSAPSEVVPAIILVGKLSGDPIDYELPGYRKSGYQVVVRSRLHAEGEELIQKAVEALTMYNVELEGHHVKYSRPKHDFVYFPASDGNNTEFSVNFDTVYVKV